MKNKPITYICIFAALIFASCSEEMTPDYMSDNPKIHAIRIEPPEARIGETVRMKMLVGGRIIDQNMATPVEWNASTDAPGSGYMVPYNQEFEMDETVWALLSNEEIPEQYFTEGWFDLPITAAINMNGKTLYAEKTMRIMETPLHGNPKIIGVEASYRLDGDLITEYLETPGETLSFQGAVPDHLGLTAITEDPEITRNDKLIYRWHVSKSKNSGGELWVYTDEAAVESVFGSDVDAEETEPSVLFSLRGEEGDEGFQNGAYDVYLIVRDKASNSESRKDDRFGLDYSYVSISVMK